MRYRRNILRIFTLALLMLIFALCFYQVRLQNSDLNQAEISLSFLVNGRERIKSWERARREFYVFLPGGAELSNTVFLLEDGASISMDGCRMTNGMSCDGIVMGHVYDFCYENGDVTYEGVITFLKSKNVPSLHIDVQSGSMDYIHLEKGNEENGEIRLYEADGIPSYSGAMAIKGRGNSSWGADKKPYNITLQEEADLLGMGKAGNWVLLSEGYNPAVIRNKLVYDFARNAGIPYSPECTWVDLYLNEEYVGLYELSEKNEIHPERVNISPENGGFLVSMEYESRLKEQKYPYVLTNSSQALRVRSGASQLQDMQLHWQTVENAILSENGTDPLTGKHWRDLIDLDSWARKYLIEEIFGNMDAGSLSQFYYVDGNDPVKKVYAGPVWDYDFSMGGEDHWLKPYTDYYVMNRTCVNEEIFTPWFPALYRQEEFLSRVKELYALEFLPLLQELVSTEIQKDWDMIQTASVLDSVRWDTAWDAVRRELDYIRSFLEKRMAFLSDLWISETGYHTVYVDPGRFGIYGCFAVKHGETLPALPGEEDLGGLGWYRADSDVLFDVSQPIYEDLYIHMKKPESNLPVIHLMPLLVVIAFLTGAVGVSIYRDRKNRSGRHDTAKAG